jgi:hypothetical protein
MARRHYGRHPDYAGEVDTAELVARLEAGWPDGWALATNGQSLQAVLEVCPPVRVAIWHNTAARPPGASFGWWQTYEAVMIRGGRASLSRGRRDLLACGTGAGGRFIGGKPAPWTRWVLGLLGAETGDDITDLFPGSGAVTAEIEAWRIQPAMLEVSPRSPREHRTKYGRARNDRDFARTHPDHLFSPEVTDGP